jgi:hypothetical protein
VFPPRHCGNEPLRDEKLPTLHTPLSSIIPLSRIVFLPSSLSHRLSFKKCLEMIRTTNPTIILRHFTPEPLRQTPRQDRTTTHPLLYLSLVPGRVRPLGYISSVLAPLASHRLISSTNFQGDYLSSISLLDIPRAMVCRYSLAFLSIFFSSLSAHKITSQLVS